MAPNGSDEAAGTSVTTPWASPNHKVVCGDVIIAAPGTYGNFSTWGPVSNCPSTSGGIDGTGGVYFATLLCGDTMGSCTSSGMRVAANNIAVEGFQASAASSFCYLADGTATNTTRYQFIAFINDIAANCDDGFTTGDGGKNHNVPGNGIDEFAVVGDIAYNANNDPICVAAIDDPGPSQMDTNAWTHVYFGGNFAINNHNKCGTDGEAFMFDTFDAHGFAAQAVMENNIAYLSARYAINLYYQGLNTGNSTFIVRNNTLFANDSANEGQATSNIGCGDITVQSAKSTLPYPISIYNNIVQTNYVNQGGISTQCYIYAGLTGGVYNTTWGGSGITNIMSGEAAPTCKAACDPGDDVIAYNGGSYGTNTYESPAFNNTSDLLTNRTGQPNCSGYTSTTACMGWNYSAQTATSDTPISDLTATATAASGKGYQPPGACAPNSLYPTWLKGIVYLQWDGTNLWEYAGLVQKPCGL
jgi:hypothetical protein